MTVLTCNDCTLHVLNTETGSPKVLPIKTPGLVSCIALTKNNRVCVVTTRGYLFAWDFNTKELLIQDFTLKHTLLTEPGETDLLGGRSTLNNIYNTRFLFTEDTAISSCEVTEDGTPLITLTCGKCYSYSRSLGWLLLSDTNSIIWKASHQNSLIKSTPQPNDTNLPLRAIQSQVKG